MRSSPGGSLILVALEHVNNYKIPATKDVRIVEALGELSIYSQEQGLRCEICRGVRETAPGYGDTRACYALTEGLLSRGERGAGGIGENQGRQGQREEACCSS